MSFEKGDRVYVNHPFVQNGTIGTIVEVTELPMEMEDEYKILLEGENRPRIFGRHSLIPEVLFEEAAKNNGDEVPAMYEMAGRIPGYVKILNKPKSPGLIICVGSRELGGHPHFHVFRSDKDEISWSNGACLMFQSNQYFDHGKNTATLTRDEIESIVAKLKEWSPVYKCIWWEHIIHLWNDSNPQYPLDPALKLPEYDYDTIVRWKEETATTDKNEDEGA